MSDRDDLRDRLDDVADDIGDDEIMEIDFRVYELVPDEVSEENKGELMIQQDIAMVDKSDDR
jgi:hypothetical protein